MVVINYNNREVSCKIVYYGPGLSGKTTNLQYVHSKVPGKTKGDLISLATDADRTLYFDFLPINIGDINGFTTKFQLYTVPGQVFYNATRKLVLRGVDGVVFIADSQRSKADENVESLSNLKENLAEYGLDLKSLPFVLQYNKRDLPDVMSVEELDKLLNDNDWAAFEASASKGAGVFDTLKYVIKLVLDRAKKSPETMRQAQAHRVEDARIPPDEDIPVERSGRQPEDSGDVAAEAGQGSGGMETGTRSISKPSSEPQPADIPESGNQPAEKGVELAASAGRAPGEAAESRLTDKPGYGQGSSRVSFDPAGSVSSATSSVAAVSTVTDEKPGDETDFDGSEEDLAGEDDKTDVERDPDNRTESTEPDRPVEVGDPVQQDADSDKRLLEKLTGLDERDEVDEAAVEEEPVERETFAVPTMRESLRRKSKKKKGFFLFRWLFRRG